MFVFLHQVQFFHTKLPHLFYYFANKNIIVNDNDNHLTFDNIT